MILWGGSNNPSLPFMSSCLVQSAERHGLTSGKVASVNVTFPRGRGRPRGSVQLRNIELLVGISRQSVAGDCLPMNPNGTDAVIRVHSFQRRFLHQYEIGNFPWLDAAE